MTVTWADTNTFGIVCKVDNSIFNSLKVFGFAVLLVKHPIFPVNSASSTKTSRAFVSFKLTSIVSILYEKLHMFWDMTVDNDGSIIFNVKLQIVEILNRISKFFYSLLECILDVIVLFLGFVIHMLHGIHLETSHPCFFIKNKFFRSIFSALNKMSSWLMRHNFLPTVNAFLKIL